MLMNQALNARSESDLVLCTNIYMNILIRLCIFIVAPSSLEERHRCLEHEFPGAYGMSALVLFEKKIKPNIQLFFFIIIPTVEILVKSFSVDPGS